MTRTHRIMIGLFAALALVSTVAFAGPHLSHKHHSNLAAAHDAVKTAIAKVSAAQEANEFDMDGHAAKAKDLLDQVDSELSQAAAAADANKK